DFQDVIIVNRVGQRFWNEVDESYNFINAALGTNGNLGRNGTGANGGGPIWAIFDADACEREGWNPEAPHVDPNGWFFKANTIGELATKIANPYQHQAIEPRVLEKTVAR